jgi:hypothetical protein
MIMGAAAAVTKHTNRMVVEVAAVTSLTAVVGAAGMNLTAPST